jgi:hypothetical protein
MQFSRIDTATGLALLPWLPQLPRSLLRLHEIVNEETSVGE